MTPGDIVCVYTHEKSDATHVTRPKVGIVLESADLDGVEVLQVKVLEKSIAPYDLEVRPFPAEAPRDPAGNFIYGGTYWKSLEDDDPDFEAAYTETEEVEAEQPQAAQSGAKNPQVAL